MVQAEELAAKGNHTGKESSESGGQGTFLGVSSRKKGASEFDRKEKRRCTQIKEESSHEKQQVRRK